jgi:hypothetical protein
LGCPAKDGVPAILELPSTPWHAAQACILVLMSCANESDAALEQISPKASVAILKHFILVLRIT